MEAPARRHQFRQRIIVLSPDAEEALLEAPSIYDVYVVGGLCDYKRIANAMLDRAGGLLSSSTPPMLNCLLLLLFFLLHRERALRTSTPPM